MEPLKSRLSRITENDPAAQEAIKNHIIKNGSCVGAQVYLHGKKYEIVDDISLPSYDIEKLDKELEYILKK